MPALTFALFVAVSSVYGFGTFSAAVPRWIVLYLWAILAAASGIALLWRSRLKLDETDLLAFVLFGWMCLSFAWTGDWKNGVYEITNAGSLLMVFLWVRRWPAGVAEAAIGAAVVLLVLQWMYPLDYGGHGNRNFQTEALIL